MSKHRVFDAGRFFDRLGRTNAFREEKVFSSTQYVARREIKIARGSVFRFIRSNSSSVREALS